MTLNREQRRRARRQGIEVDEQGREVPQPGQRAQRAQQPRTEERASPGQFLREVRGELRKVAWPSRGEVINYSIIVFITLIILTAFIGLLDWGFGEAVLKLFDR